MENPHPRQRRIRRAVAVIMALGLILVVNLLYNYGRYTIPWTFVEVERLPKAYGWPSADGFPGVYRWYYFATTFASVLSGLLAIWVGARLMLKFWQGAFFGEATIRNIRNLGVCLMIIPVITWFSATILPIILTTGRPDGAVPFRFFLNSYDMGYLLTGVILYVIGWVLSEALLIEEENKGFV